MTAWCGSAIAATTSFHSFDAKSLKAGAVVKLSAMPDGLVYVPRRHEVWVTTPGTESLAVVNVKAAGGARTPRVVATVKLDGEPEGYAVDDARGLFFTNLENKDETLTVDVATRKVVARWPTGCGAEGPRGLAIDNARRWLFAACTNGAIAFDLAHGGKVVGRVKTGGGVDNLAYDPARRLLFVASGKDGKMTITHVGDGGTLDLYAMVPTAPGARNPVVDARGAVYVEDAAGGQLLVFGPVFARAAR